MIDWARMAAPQTDQYDTGVVLELAATTTSPLRKDPWVPQPVDGHPTVFDGRVALRESEQFVMTAPEFPTAPFDNPNIPAAERLLKRWPEAHEQFATLMDSIDPHTDVSIPTDRGASSLGSSSHSLEEQFGAIIVTIDNVYGLAQALVHEMSHQKLRAMGVSLEAADRLVTNDPQQLYPSPIKIGMNRPMTAVLHAEYSFIHVTALDLKMLDGETDEFALECLTMLLARNVRRMEMGFPVIDKNVETDEEGQEFVRAFLSWAADVIDGGNRRLDLAGYGQPDL